MMNLGLSLSGGESREALRPRTEFKVLGGLEPLSELAARYHHPFAASPQTNSYYRSFY